MNVFLCVSVFGKFVALINSHSLHVSPALWPSILYDWCSSALVFGRDTQRAQLCVHRADSSESEDVERSSNLIIWKWAIWVISFRFIY